MSSVIGKPTRKRFSVKWRSSKALLRLLRLVLQGKTRQHSLAVKSTKLTPDLLSCIFVYEEGSLQLASPADKSKKYISPQKKSLNNVLL